MRAMTDTCSRCSQPATIAMTKFKPDFHDQKLVRSVEFVIEQRHRQNLHVCGIMGRRGSEQVP